MRLLRRICARTFFSLSANFTKTVAIVTAGCFLFTMVLSPAVHALLPDAVAPTAAPIIESSPVPFMAGRITDAMFFGSKDVVIAIQDLHCHGEVQRNIARILESLNAAGGLGTVYVEGGIGAINTSWATAFPDRASREKMLNGLIDAGKLTGAEYYSVRSGNYALLSGLEDEQPYRENLERLREITLAGPRIRALLPAMRNDIAFLKKRYFSTRNQHLDRFIEQKKDSGGFYRSLAHRAQAAGVDLYNYPAIADYLAAADRQKKLNYRRITRDLSSCIASFKNTLPYSVFSRLAGSTDNFSRIDDLCAKLFLLAKEYNIRIDREYPALAKYFSYLEVQRKINPLQLVQEERYLVRELREACADSGAEKDIIFMADYENCLEDFLAGKISADDYRRFTGGAARFDSLWRQYVSADGLPSLSPYDGLIGEFYRVNVARNAFFLKHLFGDETPECGTIADETVNDRQKVLESLKTARVRTMVTGGFHTAGVTSLLREKKISYIVITPSVTRDTALSDKLYDLRAREETGTIPAQTIALNLYSRDLLGLPADETRERVTLDVVKGAIIREFLDAGRSPKKMMDNVNEDSRNGKLPGRIVSFTENKTSYLFDYVYNDNNGHATKFQLSIEKNENAAGNNDLSLVRFLKSSLPSLLVPSLIFSFFLMTGLAAAKTMSLSLVSGHGFSLFPHFDLTALPFYFFLFGMVHGDNVDAVLKALFDKSGPEQERTLFGSQTPGLSDSNQTLYVSNWRRAAIAVRRYNKKPKVFNEFLRTVLDDNGSAFSLDDKAYFASFVEEYRWELDQSLVLPALQKLDFDPSELQKLAVSMLKSESQPAKLGALKWLSSRKNNESTNSLLVGAAFSFLGSENDDTGKIASDALRVLGTGERREEINKILEYVLSFNYHFLVSSLRKKTVEDIRSVKKRFIDEFPEPVGKSIGILEDILNYSVVEQKSGDKTPWIRNDSVDEIFSTGPSYWFVVAAADLLIDMNPERRHEYLLQKQKLLNWQLSALREVASSDPAFPAWERRYSEALESTRRAINRDYRSSNQPENVAPASLAELNDPATLPAMRRRMLLLRAAISEEGALNAANRNDTVSAVLAHPDWFVYGDIFDILERLKATPDEMLDLALELASLDSVEAKKTGLGYVKGTIDPGDPGAPEDPRLMELALALLDSKENIKWAADFLSEHGNASVVEPLLVRYLRTGKDLEDILTNLETREELRQAALAAGPNPDRQELETREIMSPTALLLFKVGPNPTRQEMDDILNDTKKLPRTLRLLADITEQIDHSPDIGAKALRHILENPSKFQYTDIFDILEKLHATKDELSEMAFNLMARDSAGAKKLGLAWLREMNIADVRMANAALQLHELPEESGGSGKDAAFAEGILEWLSGNEALPNGNGIRRLIAPAYFLNAIPAERRMIIEVLKGVNQATDDNEIAAGLLRYVHDKDSSMVEKITAVNLMGRAQYKRLEELLNGESPLPLLLAVSETLTGLYRFYPSKMRHYQNLFTKALSTGYRSLFEKRGNISDDDNAVMVKSRRLLSPGIAEKIENRVREAERAAADEEFLSSARATGSTSPEDAAELNAALDRFSSATPDEREWAADVLSARGDQTVVVPLVRKYMAEYPENAAGFFAVFSALHERKILTRAVFRLLEPEYFSSLVRSHPAIVEKLLSGRNLDNQAIIAAAGSYLADGTVSAEDKIAAVELLKQARNVGNDAVKLIVKYVFNGESDPRLLEAAYEALLLLDPGKAKRYSRMYDDMRRTGGRPSSFEGQSRFSDESGRSSDERLLADIKKPGTREEALKKLADMSDNGELDGDIRQSILEYISKNYQSFVYAGFFDAYALFFKENARIELKKLALTMMNQGPADAKRAGLAQLTEMKAIDGNATDVALAMLVSKDPNDRAVAEKALSSIADEKLISNLVRKYFAEGSDSPLYGILSSFHRGGLLSDAAFRLLKPQVLRKMSSTDRKAVARALAGPDFSEPAVIARLQALLSDKNHDIRVSAISILKMLKFTNNVDVLFDAYASGRNDTPADADPEIIKRDAETYALITEYMFYKSGLKYKGERIDEDNAKILESELKSRKIKTGDLLSYPQVSDDLVDLFNASGKHFYDSIAVLLKSDFTTVPRRSVFLLALAYLLKFDNAGIFDQVMKLFDAAWFSEADRSFFFEVMLGNILIGHSGRLTGHLATFLENNKNLRIRLSGSAPLLIENITGENFDHVIVLLEKAKADDDTLKTAIGALHGRQPSELAMHFVIEVLFERRMSDDPDLKALMRNYARSLMSSNDNESKIVGMQTLNDIGQQDDIDAVVNQLKRERDSGGNPAIITGLIYTLGKLILRTNHVLPVAEVEQVVRPAVDQVRIYVSENPEFLSGASHDDLEKILPVLLGADTGTDPSQKENKYSVANILGIAFLAAGVIAVVLAGHAFPHILPGTILPAGRLMDLPLPGSLGMLVVGIVTARYYDENKPVSLRERFRAGDAAIFNSPAISFPGHDKYRLAEYAIDNITVQNYRFIFKFLSDIGASHAVRQAAFEMMELDSVYAKKAALEELNNQEVDADEMRAVARELISDSNVRNAVLWRNENPGTPSSYLYAVKTGIFTLGRIGNEEDLDRLFELLNEPVLEITALKALGKRFSRPGNIVPKKYISPFALKTRGRFSIFLKHDVDAAVNLFLVNSGIMINALKDRQDIPDAFFDGLIQSSPEKAYLLLKSMIDSPANERTVTLLGKLGETKGVDGRLRRDIVDTIIRAASRRNAVQVFSSLEKLPVANHEMRQFAYRFIDSDDPDIRAKAVAALGRSGNRDSIPYLIRVLKQYPQSAAVIAGAFETLAKARQIEPGDERIIQALIDALSPDSYDRLLKTIYILHALDRHYIAAYERIIGFNDEDADLRALRGAGTLPQSSQKEHLLVRLLSPSHSLPVAAGAATQLIRFYPRKRLHYVKRFSAVVKKKLSPEGDSMKDLRALLGGTFAGRFALRSLRAIGKGKIGTDPVLNGTGYFRFFGDGYNAVSFARNEVFNPHMDTFIVAPLPLSFSADGMIDVSSLSRRVAVRSGNADVLLDVWAAPVNNGRGHAWSLWYKPLGGNRIDAAFRAQASLAVATLVQNDPVVRGRLGVRGRGVTFVDTDEKLFEHMNLPGSLVEDPAFADTLFFVSRPGGGQFEDLWDEIRQKMASPEFEKTRRAVRQRGKISISVTIDPAAPGAVLKAVTNGLPPHLRKKITPVPPGSHHISLARFPVRLKPGEPFEDVVERTKGVFEDFFKKPSNLRFAARGIGFASPSSALFLPVFNTAKPDLSEYISDSFEEKLGNEIVYRPEKLLPHIILGSAALTSEEAGELTGYLEEFLDTEWGPVVPLNVNVSFETGNGEHRILAQRKLFPDRSVRTAGRAPDRIFYDETLREKLVIAGRALQTKQISLYSRAMPLVSETIDLKTFNAGLYRLAKTNYFKNQSVKGINTFLVKGLVPALDGPDGKENLAFLAEAVKNAQDARVQLVFDVNLDAGESNNATIRSLTDREMVGFLLSYKDKEPDLARLNKFLDTVDAEALVAISSNGQPVSPKLEELIAQRKLVRLVENISDRQDFPLNSWAVMETFRQHYNGDTENFLENLDRAAKAPGTLIIGMDSDTILAMERTMADAEEGKDFGAYLMDLLNGQFLKRRQDPSFRYADAREDALHLRSGKLPVFDGHYRSLLQDLLLSSDSSAANADERAEQRAASAGILAKIIEDGAGKPAFKKVNGYLTQLLKDYNGSTDADEKERIIAAVAGFIYGVLERDTALLATDAAPFVTPVYNGYYNRAIVEMELFMKKNGLEEIPVGEGGKAYLRFQEPVKEYLKRKGADTGEIEKLLEDLERDHGKDRVREAVRILRAKSRDASSPVRPLALVALLKIIDAYDDRDYSKAFRSAVENTIKKAVPSILGIEKIGSAA